MYKNKIQPSELLKHKTKLSTLKRFLLVFSIFMTYFIFVSIKYGIKQGIGVSILTWTFFVFCTPIADAGFLLDFPNRLITGMRMIHSEIIVWTIATIINIFTLSYNPNIYNGTKLLILFKKIILTPYPYWGIIILSALGTYLSVYFGDELLDVAKKEERKKFSKHNKKYKIIFTLFIIAVIIIFYKSLIKSLGLNI